MSLRADLKKVIDTWQDWKARTDRIRRPRAIRPMLPKENALALIGVRRCGKTFIATELLCSEEKEPSLYMNFEDPLFVKNNEVRILDELISVYTEFSQVAPQILLFDEIHNIENWERWARKIIDLQQTRLIVTGSSAKMLSSDLATSLTGRSVTETVWPLSFSEFLQFSEKNPRNENEHLGALREYMHLGGFPQIVLSENEEEKEKLLKQYFNDILYNDVIKRNQIRSADKLEKLARFYLSNSAALHSCNSVRKAFGVSVDMAIDYTRFLQEAFLIFQMNRYHPNLKTQLRDSKKIYAVDTGLRNQNAFAPNPDFGKLTENIVYLEIRRRGKEPYYFQENGEVDFLITDNGKPIEAIQVCYDNLEDPKTYDREYRSLLEGLQATGLDEGLILTKSREERTKREGKNIIFMPLYKWLLSMDR